MDGSALYNALSTLYPLWTLARVSCVECECLVWTGLMWNVALVACGCLPCG